MSFKILVVGDPHFKPEDVLEVEMFISKMEALVEKESPDLIVILGDVLHTHERIHAQALNQAVIFVEKIVKKTETLILVGNHDYYNNQQFLTNLHWMNCLKHINGLTVVDKLVVRNFSDMKFLFVPYVPPGRFLEAFGEENFEDSTAIFAHTEFYGAKMGSFVSTEGDQWSLKYPPVISGHIHNKQMPQPNIVYVGASRQIAMGEADNPTIAIFTFTKNKPYDLREVDLGLPRKKIVHLDVDKAQDFALIESKDSLKLSISGEYSEFKAFKKTKKYKDLIQSGTKVVFKPKRVEVKHNAEKIASVMNETDFTKILSILIERERNPHLYELHEKIVNDSDVKAEDVIFLDVNE